MFGFIISIAVSLNFLYTALGLFGQGTCSFGGGRVIRVQTNLGDAGAVSCNLAAFGIILVVIGYWTYVYSNRD
tara:strand:- start:358 stop:576 length:219 start_codon:yes stop_codon:yes gene_type:complete